MLASEEHELLKAVLQGSSDAIFVKDLEGRYILINEIGAGVLGLTVEAVVGKTDLDLFPQVIAERIRQDDRKVIDTGSSLTVEESVRVCGEERHFFVRKSPYRDRSGGIAGTIGIAHDITDRKRIEAERQVSEDRFRNLFEQSPMPVQVLSPDGRTLQVNSSWARFWGVPQGVVDDQIASHNVFQDKHLEELGLYPYFRKGFEGETALFPPVLYNPAEIGKPGRSRWTQTQIYPIKFERGVVREAVLIFNDITERREAERTLDLLSETSLRLSSSLDSLEILNRAAEISVKHFGGTCLVFAEGSDGKAVSLLEAGVTESNPPASDELKLALAEAFLAAPSDYGPIMPEWGQEPEPSRAATIELLGRHGFTSYLRVPVHGRQGVDFVITLLSRGRFYTDADFFRVKEFADRVSLGVQNAKLYEDARRAIGLRDEFLAIASHELRTPLTSLSILIESVLRLIRRNALATAPMDRLSTMFQSSSQQLKSLGRLLNELLDVSKSGVNTIFRKSVVEVDLGRTVREVVARFQAQLLASDCEVEILEERAVVGSWDKLRIDQVVVNLLTNAMKYGKNKPIRIAVGIESERAVLKVTDLGIGIAREDVERIFGRFERAVSHQNFGGLGLGLFIVREIVRAHDGSVQVESEPDRGATFTVKLPLR